MPVSNALPSDGFVLKELLKKAEKLTMTDFSLFYNTDDLANVVIEELINIIEIQSEKFKEIEETIEDNFEVTL